jgi:dolichol kinase
LPPLSLLQIIVRKVYHLLAMGLFVPVFFWDLQLLALSLTVAFAVLVLLEMLRCIRVPLLGQAVQDFMQVRVSVWEQRLLCSWWCLLALAAASQHSAIGKQVP